MRNFWLLGAILLAFAAPASAENWQFIGKIDTISSIEVDKDALRRGDHASVFRIRLKYEAKSIPGWKGDTLVATAILGCDTAIPLSFDHITYYKDGKEAGSLLAAPYPEGAPILPGELYSLVCAPAKPVNWRSLGTREGQEVYFDPDSVTSEGSKRSVQMKDNRTDRYLIIGTVIDCDAHTLTIRSMDTYSLAGDRLASKKDLGTIPLTPGTPGADIQAQVCN